MHNEIFKMENLPLAEMREVGLIKDDKLVLDQEDLQALLLGRRTDMITLRSLSLGGEKIHVVHSKVSLRESANGESQLVFHPIYKRVNNPDFLTTEESESLQNKEMPSLNKMIADGQGKSKEIIAEFDNHTKEFVITDSMRLVVPEVINNEHLNEEKKELYKKGKRVVLGEGTEIRFTGNGRKFVESNKTALIMSVSNEKGIYYVHYDNVSPLDGKRAVDHDQLSEGYYKQVDRFATDTAIKDITREIDPDLENEQSLGYKKPGISR